MTPVTYTSEQPKDYAKALSEASTLDELVKVAEAWQEVASDALAIVKGMTPADFAHWRKGLAIERRGKFAGLDFQEKYAAVLMPERLFKVSMMALEFSVPWGLMYLRLKETGRLDEALQ
jgi:hypothetical protein